MSSADPHHPVDRVAGPGDAGGGDRGGTGEGPARMTVMPNAPCTTGETLRGNGCRGGREASTRIITEAGRDWATHGGGVSPSLFRPRVAGDAAQCRSAPAAPDGRVLRVRIADGSAETRSATSRALVTNPQNRRMGMATTYDSPEPRGSLASARSADSASWASWASWASSGSFPVGAFVRLSGLSGFLGLFGFYGFLGVAHTVECNHHRHDDHA